MRRFVSRLGFVFWALICGTIAIDSEAVGFVASPLQTVATTVRQAILGLVARMIGIPGELRWEATGSGDRLEDWLELGAIATVSVIAAAIWAARDRRPDYDARLRSWLRVLVRYVIAGEMIAFGLSKLFLLQFGLPNGNQLSQSYSTSSPMSLLWNFVGVSPAYEMFGGAMEMIGGLLLVFRRTTTLGTLILLPVMTHVVVLNYCYDVPDKILSSSLLAMCVYLVLPEARRFFDLLWRHRAVEAEPLPATPSTWARLLKLAVIALLVGAPTWSSLEIRAVRQAASWYAGYWSVTAFVRDGRALPADDPSRWLRLRLEDSSEGRWLRWRLVDNSYGPQYDLALDGDRMHLTDGAHQLHGELRYTRQSPVRWHLEGAIDSAQISADLAWIEVSTMPLMTRGFHWINERPYLR